VPFPVVALVGYTNAGKSTLFNRLTESKVLAKDLLFATLDPTMRGVKLPHGAKIILSDTVGFIADLPTELVAAFRATLEEVLEADVIVHVRDTAHDESAAQKADVLKVLEELGVSADRPMLEVLNKIDLLAPEQRQGLLSHNLRREAIAVSALSGDGIPALLIALEKAVTRDNITVKLKLDAADGSALAFAYRHAQVLERRDRAGKISLSLRIHPDDLGRFENRFHRKIAIEQGVAG
jgi:GTP-binding protein HflX